MVKVPAKPQLKPQVKPQAKPEAKVKAVAKSAVAARASAPAGDTMALALKRVAAQNAQLTKALQDAEARIAELERQRDSALDRIEWVIDSLHSLREEQG
jgi:chromosome segregation ATPase